MKRPDTIMIEGHAYSWRVIFRDAPGADRGMESRPSATARLVRTPRGSPTGSRAHHRRAVSGTDLAGAVAGRGGVISAAFLEETA